MIDIDYTAVITTISGIIGGGWLFNLYSAKPRKTSIELENVGKAMEEMNNVIETMRTSNKVYRDETEETIKRLSGKIEKLEQTITVKEEAIYSAYDCEFPKKASDCIVLRVFKQNCKACNISTKIIDDDDNNEEDATADNA